MKSSPRTLTIALRQEYFDQVVSGTKLDEFRLTTPYWEKRLANASYERLVLTLGYPAKDDAARRREFAWDGFKRITMQHPLFGPEPVEVFAISLRKPWPHALERC